MDGGAGAEKASPTESVALSNRLLLLTPPEHGQRSITYEIVRTATEVRMSLVNPAPTLKSLQRQIDDGMPVPGIRGTRDTALHLNTVNIGGTVRMDYFYVDKRKVTALVMVAHAPSVEGLLVLQLAYAVPPELQGRGNAQKTVLAVIDEIDLGCRQSGKDEYFVEAVVAKDNKPSQAVAAKTISSSPETVIDPASGEEVLRYRKRAGRRPIKRGRK